MGAPPDAVCSAYPPTLLAASPAATQHTKLTFRADANKLSTIGGFWKDPPQFFKVPSPFKLTLGTQVGGENKCTYVLVTSVRVFSMGFSKCWYVFFGWYVFKKHEGAQGHSNGGMPTRPPAKVASCGLLGCTRAL